MLHLTLFPNHTTFSTSRQNIIVSNKFKMKLFFLSIKQYRKSTMLLIILSLKHLKCLAGTSILFGGEMKKGNLQTEPSIFKADRKYVRLLLVGSEWNWKTPSFMGVREGKGDYLIAVNKVTEKFPTCAYCI